MIQSHRNRDHPIEQYQNTIRHIYLEIDSQRPLSAMKGGSQERECSAKCMKAGTEKMVF